jgi:hypothetical protein
MNDYIHATNGEVLPRNRVFIRGFIAEENGAWQYFLESVLIISFYGMNAFTIEGNSPGNNSLYSNVVVEIAPG